MAVPICGKINSHTALLNPQPPSPRLWCYTIDWRKKTVHVYFDCIICNVYL